MMRVIREYWNRVRYFFIYAIDVVEAYVVLFCIWLYFDLFDDIEYMYRRVMEGFRGIVRRIFR